MTYHLTDDGPKPCTATVRACPLGGEHYQTVAEADGAFEALQPGFIGLKRNNPPLVQFDELFEKKEFDEEAYRAVAKEYFANLSADETEALASYAMSSYYDINEALYNGKRRNKKVAAWVRSIDSALQSAPKPPEEVWRRLRGADTSENFLAEEHKEGDVLKLKGYSSTSETADALSQIPTDVDFYMRDVPSEDWDFDPNFKYTVVPSRKYTEGAARNVIFKLRANSAAPVSVTRSTTNEQEWMIPRGKKFRIVKIHPNVDLAPLKRGGKFSTRAQIFELEEV
jgi:hypothetical protein